MTSPRPSDAVSDASGRSHDNRVASTGATTSGERDPVRSLCLVGDETSLVSGDSDSTGRALRIDCPTAPTLPLAPINIDECRLRTSILNLQDILRQLEAFHLQAEAYRALQEDHVALQREHNALRQELSTLQATLTRAEQLAAPFVGFCQRRYDLLRFRLENTQLQLAETMSALAVRVDNSLEIACLQDRLRAHQALQADVVAEFQQQIDDLEARLAANAPITGSSHLAKVIADRDIALIERDSARTALNASITELDTAKAACSVAVSERDAAVGDRDSAIAERNAARVDHDIAVRDRDQAIVERDAVARDRDFALFERDQVRSERDAAIHDRDRIQSERDTAVTDRDSALRDRDRAQGERDSVLVRRNLAARDRDVAVAERDAAVANRNTAICDLNSAQVVRDRAIRDRDLAVCEREAAVGECNAANNAYGLAVDERDTAVAERDEARRALRASQDDLRQQALVQKDLKTQLQLFHQRVTSLNGELADLRVKTDGERTSSQVILNRSLKLRDELQGKLDGLAGDLQNKQALLTKAHQTRIRLHQALDTVNARVDTQRTRIAALERDIASHQCHGVELQQLRDEKIVITKDLDDERRARVRAEACQESSRQRQFDAENERDRLVAERQAALAQLRSLSSMFGLTAPSANPPTTSATTPQGQSLFATRSPTGAAQTKHSPSDSAPTQTTSTLGIKRQRSPTGTPPSSQKRRRRGPLQVNSDDSGDDDEGVVGHVLSSLSVSPSWRVGHHHTGGTPGDPINVDDDGNKGGPVAGSFRNDGQDDQGVHVGSSHDGHTTANEGDHIGDDHDENDAANKDVHIENDSDGHCASCEDDHNGSVALNQDDQVDHVAYRKDDHDRDGIFNDNDDTDGGSSPLVLQVQPDQGRGGPGIGGFSPASSTSNSSSSDGSRQRDGDGGSRSSDSISLHSSDKSLLDRKSYRDLLPTVVPRRQWIPGYRHPVRYATAAHCAPWPLQDVSRLCIRRLNVDTLFSQWTRPLFWLFPQQTKAPPANAWYSDLVTEANIRALYAATPPPWAALRRLGVPRSFELTGWFADFCQRYTDFEEAHLQVFWETTHKLPIANNASPFLKQHQNDCRVRRMRTGPRWKKLLEHLLEGLKRGECDLDLLLDPYFLHLPARNEQTRWYPGLGEAQRPADLLDALRIADAADPWRNQYRANVVDHPGSRVMRLNEKFFPDRGSS